MKLRALIILGLFTLSSAIGCLMTPVPTPSVGIEQTLINALGFYQMGKSYLDKRENQLAINSFQDALKLQPEYMDAEYGLAQAYFQAGQAEEGLKHLKLAESRLVGTTLKITPSGNATAPEASPDDKDERKIALQKNFYDWLRKNTEENAVDKELVAHLESTIEQAPNQPQLYYALGILYFQAGEYNRAKPLFEKVVELAPESGTGQDAKLLLSLMQ
ncbi:MAG: tetratricopeptide repeat protein [Planctomycetes bacterium]|nr:tetratricopeptide repeat protein [Planctomycetota bacterium]